MYTYTLIRNTADMKQGKPNQDTQNAIWPPRMVDMQKFVWNNFCLGCSTAGLTAKDGGHAVGLSGTILTMRQAVLIWL